MKQFALVMVAVIACVASAPSGSERIAGGTQAAKGQYPFVVSITRNDSHICGGFIYNDRWIVTAASCVYDTVMTEVKVTVGSLSLITPDPEEQVIKILSNKTHEKYDPFTKLNDLALLQLSRPIVFGATAQAIRYDEIDELNIPFKANIVGWGATVDGGLPASRLRTAPVEDLLASCLNYGEEQYFPNNMICAGNSAATTTLSGPCDFDQGTPLIQEVNYDGEPEIIVVGIMSKNQGCKDLTVPSIYTRLAVYYAWLLQNAGQQPENLH